MSRIIPFALFFILFIALDFYAFQGYKLLIKKWLPNHTSLMHVTYWAVPLAFFLLVLGVFVFSPNPTKSRLLVWSVSVLFGLFLGLIVWVAFLLLDDVVRLVKFSGSKLSSESDVKTISRSEFIITSGALLAGTFFSSMVYGIASGAHNYQVHKKTLRLKNLPSAFNGFKIVQISDVHAGSFWSKDGVRKGIQMILDQKPDAIFFTGDLVNSTSKEFEEFKEMFGLLKAKFGVYSVLGNHDYGDYHRWPDANGVTKEQNLDEMRKHHADMGWNLLLNENKIIEKDGEQLAILGVQNWSASSQFHSYGDMTETYKG